MHSELTLGSLFDGSGGFPLGAVLNDIKPVWASEIEPFPIRVTTKRIPSLKHYGDISDINGAEIEPVDIISFGSPCTDMSVAGKRAGLDGTQSVLFYEAIRIIKEMRCATDGDYPRFILWENVPGAFSSNKGHDFKAVLDAIVQIVEPGAEVPAPEKGGWPYADILLGDGWSIAYRTVDAQHFGVAQRRKRIYLIADFGSERAGQVLFEPEGVSRNFTPCGGSWQRTAGNAEERAGASGNSVTCLNDQGGQRMDISHEMTATLRAQAHHPPCVMQSSGFCTEHSARSRSVGYEEERAPTLRAGVVPGVAIENHPTDGRCKVSENGLVQTLTSRMGTGGMNVPLVAYGLCSDKSNSMLSDNPHSGIYKASTSRTIDANGVNPGCNQGGIAVIALQGSMIGREDKNGPQGNGVSQGISFTLNTADRHAVAYAMTTGCFTQITENVTPALMARDYKDAPVVSQPCYGSDRSASNQGAKALIKPSFDEEQAQTLVARKPGAVAQPERSAYIVRRLTPTECARLQGFPDWWCDGLETAEPTEAEIAWWADVFETHRLICGTSSKPKSRNQIVKWLQNPRADSAEYKMWGNGVALPCVCFVLRGIAQLTQPDVR